MSAEASVPSKERAVLPLAGIHSPVQSLSRMVMAPCMRTSGGLLCDPIASRIFGREATSEGG
jgi:hypothetical protein